MDRTIAANYATVAGKRAFQNANPGLGILVGTGMDAADPQAWQEEIVGVIEAAGLIPSAANLAQLLAALRKLFGGAGSFSNPSYQTVAGGLIVQFGNVSVPAGTLLTVTYADTFPTGALAGGTAVGSASVTAFSPINMNLFSAGANSSHFQLGNPNGSAVSVPWIVLGI